MPYVSTSITEFWRRWHITLSFWLRDYLYISLGGNRKGISRTYINLSVTMLLGGLWHGASWNFVIWGAMHGFSLVVHKLWSTYTKDWQHIKETLPYKMFAWLLTMLLVGMLWIPFRSPDFLTTISFYNKLLPSIEGIAWHHPTVLVVLFCVVFWHLAYVWKSKFINAFPSARPYDTIPAYVIGTCIIMIVFFAPVNTSPFIYFQF